MGRLRWVLAIGGLAAAPLASCITSSDVFTCGSNAECTGEGNGQCQANGFCAFPDAMCESGLRYGEFAGGGYAQMCVPVEPPGSTTVTGSDGDSTGPATTDPTIGDSDDASAGSTSSGQDSTSSTGPGDASQTGGSSSGETSTCAFVVDDEFVGDELAPDWTVVAGGTVQVANGRLELRPDAMASTTVVSYAPQVDFDGLEFMVNVAELTPDPYMVGALALYRDDEGAVIDLVLDGESTLVGRYFDAAARKVTESGPQAVDTGDATWLRIRESEGRVLFEYGPTPDTMTEFFGLETDIRSWSGTLLILANDIGGEPDDRLFAIERASICVPER